MKIKQVLKIYFALVVYDLRYFIYYLINDFLIAYLKCFNEDYLLSYSNITVAHFLLFNFTKHLNYDLY